MASESDRANPYEAPRSLDSLPLETTASSATRRIGIWCLRISLLFLVIPAAYNTAHFNAEVFIGWPNPLISLVFQLTNWFWLVVTGLALWFGGLWLLEGVTGLAHRWCSRRDTRLSWKEALYATLQTAPILASFGALTWGFWVFAFYQLQWNFYLISIPAGILGHGLAAALYLPLFYRWYRLG